MINAIEAVLVLVDFQVRLEEIVHRRDLVLPNVLRIVKGCRALDIPILTTEQVPEKIGPTLPELAALLEGMPRISKVAFSIYRDPEFMLALENTSRKQVILAGIEAHICVIQSGLDLLDAGFQVHILSDAVFSRAEENRQLALQRLHDAGATITSVEMALFELIRTPKHPSFRTISKLLK